MRLAKPILLTATPLGVLCGLYEAWKLSPGLAFLMAAMVGVMAAAIGSVVLTVRRENAEEAERRQAAAGSRSGDDSGDRGARVRRA
jgi:hypothetical protein